MTADDRAPSTPPVVSVTIPVLNGGKFLAEAIESVIAQTYRSWELLVVEDGSRDASPVIAQRYAREWPGRIRYLEHPGHENRGMTESRNLGLRNSLGRYIARLDADDTLRPNAFADKVAILDANPGAVMVYGPTQMWFSWEGGSDLDQIYTPVVPLNAVVPPPAAMLAFLGDERNEAMGMFVRREIMEAIGGYTAEGGYLYEDNALNVKICLWHPVYVSGRNWYRYRQHADSYCAVKRARGEYDAGRLHYLEWVGKYLSDKNVQDPEVWAVQRRALEQQRAYIESKSASSPPPG